jgi:hypothetical protein
MGDATGSAMTISGGLAEGIIENDEITGLLLPGFNTSVFRGIEP